MEEYHPAEGDKSYGYYWLMVHMYENTFEHKAQMKIDWRAMMMMMMTDEELLNGRR